MERIAIRCPECDGRGETEGGWMYKRGSAKPREYRGVCWVQHMGSYERIDPQLCPVCAGKRAVRINVEIEDLEEMECAETTDSKSSS